MLYSESAGCFALRILGDVEAGVLVVHGHAWFMVYTNVPGLKSPVAPQRFSDFVSKDLKL